MTREQILDHALKLLLERGLKRFSVTEVAERLGVVKSALYFYFPEGKNGIVNAVFQREEDKVLKAMEEAAAHALGCREKLRAMAFAKLETIMNLARLFSVSTSVTGEIASYCRAHREAFQERERALLEKVLADGMASGEVRPMDVQLLASAIQAALLEVTQKAVENEALSAEALSDLLVDVLFFGISNRRQA